MIGAIIQARMGSSRLPGKVLFPVSGHPLLYYMIQRTSAARLIERVMIATSTEPSDDPIAGFCEAYKTACYRGSLNDVLDRYYGAARQMQCDTIVRLTADCPLIDPRVIDAVAGRFAAETFDYVANTAPPEGRTYPDGMDVEVFSFKALERAWREARKPSEREHVTFYFWKNPRRFATFRCDLTENLSDYRLTVDYPADFEVVGAVLRHLYRDKPDFSMQDVISFLDHHPELRSKNAHIASNLGWQPSLEADRRLGLEERTHEIR